MWTSKICGLVKHGLVKCGLVKRGLVKCGQVKCGLVLNDKITNYNIVRVSCIGDGKKRNGNIILF